MNSNPVQFAGFWVRTLADLVDSILLDLLAILLVFAVVGAASVFRIDRAFSGGALDWVDSLWVQGGVVASRGILAIVYFTLSTAHWGTTLGKRLFRIYVVSSATQEPVSLRQSWLRCVGYLASYLTLGVGFVVAAFQPEKRALHDWIAGTACVIRPKTFS